MKFFDCFPFNRELDILELRLEELDPVVDHFVLVESTRDYQLREKPLVYALNRGRFRRFYKKIEHVVVQDVTVAVQGEAIRFGEADTYHNDMVWSQHRYQRNQIIRGLELLGAADEDICLIADVDEIPSREVVKFLKEGGGNEWVRRRPIFIPVRTHFFFMDLVCDFGVVFRLVAATVADARRYTPDGLRVECKADPSHEWLDGFKPAGWHYTYFGTPAENVQKLSGMCETSFLRPELLSEARMRERMVNCTDPLDRPLRLRKIDVYGDDYPETVKANRARWSKYFSEAYAPVTA